MRVSTEDERHAVRPALLETEQRACDAHGAADHAALVDHVAPVHKVPALCELDLAGAVWLGLGLGFILALGLGLGLG